LWARSMTARFSCGPENFEPCRKSPRSQTAPTVGILNSSNERIVRPKSEGLNFLRGCFGFRNHGCGCEIRVLCVHKVAEPLLEHYKRPDFLIAAVIAHLVMVNHGFHRARTEIIAAGRS